MKRVIKYLVGFSPLLVTLLALSFGGKPIPVTNIIDIFSYRITGNTIFNPAVNAVEMNVLLNIRLPRIFMTLLAGLSLSVSGATFQALLKNPMVDPYILGLSSGAAFGVSTFSILLGMMPAQLSAFIFGLSAVGISYFFARKRGEATSIALVLAGVMVTAVFTAMLSAVQLIIDPLRLQSLIYWTMGSFNTASWEKVRGVAPWVAASALVVFVMRWRLNLLSLDDAQARYLGVHVTRDKTILVLAASFLASCSVSAGGIISLMGFMIPHIARMIFGSDNRLLIPACMVIGASFLTLVDIFSRTLFTFEVPIGIFTTLIGAPFFLYLLRRKVI